MGANVSEESQLSHTWQDGITRIADRQLLFECYRDGTGQTFIGREIDIPNRGYKEQLIEDLQKKETQLQDGIYPISKYFFSSQSALCSQQQKCLVLSDIPQYSLEQFYNQRMQTKRSFRTPELLKLIDRISTAIVSQFSSPEITFVPIQMLSIVYLKGQPYLIDKLLIASERRITDLRGKYPSPQLLEKDRIGFDKIDTIGAHLFALGIMVLELIYGKDFLNNVYQRFHKHSRINKINGQHLIKAITNIIDPVLRQKVLILTHLSPQIRRDVFKIQSKKGSSQKQPTEKSTERSLSQISLSQRNSAIKANVKAMPRVSLTRQQKEVIPTKIPSDKSIDRPLSQNSKQNISIKLVNAPLVNVPMKSNKNPPLPPPPPRQPSYSGSRRNRFNKENLDKNIQITPKKPIVKHQFSTIKEVTECDQLSDYRKSNYRQAA